MPEEIKGYLNEGNEDICQGCEWQDPHLKFLRLPTRCCAPNGHRTLYRDTNGRIKCAIPSAEELVTNVITEARAEFRAKKLNTLAELVKATWNAVKTTSRGPEGFITPLVELDREGGDITRMCFERDDYDEDGISRYYIDIEVGKSLIHAYGLRINSNDITLAKFREPTELIKDIDDATTIACRIGEKLVAQK